MNDKGCAFCNKGLIDRRAEIFWLAISNKKKLVIILDNAGYQTERKVDINYCPYCGKKLKDEEKEDD